MRIALCLVAAALRSCVGIAAEAAPRAAVDLRADISGSTVKLMWVTPPETTAVACYVDITKREPTKWLRILLKRANPPFTFLHPARNHEYAWRIVTVDRNDRADYSVTPWRYFITGVAGRFGS